MLKIPTDSLTKFVAVCGFVLFFGGLYGLYNSFELNHEFELVENKRIHELQKMDEKSMLELEKAIEEAEKREANGYKKKVKKSIDKTKVYEVEAEIEMDAIEFPYRRTKLMIFFLSSAFSVIIGFILSVFGFRKWRSIENTLYSIDSEKLVE